MGKLDEVEKEVVGTATVGVVIDAVCAAVVVVCPVDTVVPS